MYFKEIIDRIEKMPKDHEAVIFTGDDYDGSGVFFYREHNEQQIITQDSEGYSYGITASNCQNVFEVKAYKKGFKDKIKKVYDDKSPKTKSRHIGVELEFISTYSRTELEMMIAGAGLEDTVTLKEDGSIDTEDEYEHSHEICILSTEKKIHSIVKRLCVMLKGASIVNSSCGMHVHLDMRDRSVGKAYANLYAYQPLLYSMCPKSRVNNDYSEPVTDYTPFDVHRLGNRYVGINKHSYSKHQTLEVRIHSGTLNEVKISNWIKLLIKITDRPIRSVFGVALVTDYKQAKQKLRLTGKLENYVKSRLSAFGEDHENTGIGIAV